MKHLTFSALPLLFLAPLGVFAQTLSVIGSNSVKTLTPVDQFPTDSSSVFILYGDGYFAFSTGEPIQSRQHKYAMGNYTASAFFAKKKKLSPPAKVTNVFPVNTNTGILNTPPVAMGGASVKLGASWLPVPDQKHFTILTFMNTTMSAYSGTISFFYDANQTLDPVDMIIKNTWASNPTYPVSLDPNFPNQVNLVFSNLLPGEQRHLYFFTKTEQSAAPGTPINTKAELTVNGQAGEMAKHLATFSILSNKYAHDPNSKRVHPELICSSPNPERLDYTIAFQNDGENFANDVKVTDVFDPQLDVQTLALSDSNFPCTLSAPNGPSVDFDFNAIKLPGLNQQWPNQYTYDQTIGWFDFSVYPVPSPAPGEIPNSAEIFFDALPSIWTNKAVTTVLTEDECASRGHGGGFGGSTGDDDRDTDGRSTGFSQKTLPTALPNPFGGQLEVWLPEALLGASSLVEVFNLQGQKIAGGAGHDEASVVFETANWPSGTYFVHYRASTWAGAIRVVKH